MRRRPGRSTSPAVVARPGPGDTVVAGRIRARLLGVPLLDLEARVVVAAVRQATDAPLDAVGAPVRRPAPKDGSAPPELARAVRLLAEGSSALAEARRTG